MSRENERTKQMKGHFMELHEAGHTIKEIAKMCNLTPITIYRSLQEIADKQGVSRESLLQRIVTPTPRQYKLEEQRLRITAEALVEGFDSALNDIREIITMVDEIIKEEERK